MIYAISAGAAVAKAYKGTAKQVSVETMVGSIKLDPEVTGVDIAVVTPKDFAGFKGKNLADMINARHENVTVLLLFNNEKDLKKLPSLKNVRQLKVSKFTDVEVKKVIDEVIQEVAVSDNKEVFVPEVKESTAPVETANENIGEEKEEDVTPRNTEPLIVEVEVQQQEEQEVQVVIPEVKVDAPVPIEERIRKLNAHADFQAFSQSMRRESIVKELVRENTRYSAAVQMLETLDREVQVIFKSTASSADDKFNEMRSVALKRIGYKEVTNNILVEKVNKIILAAIASAEETTQEKVDRIKESLGTIEKAGIVYKDRTTLERIIKERLELQMDLTEAIETVMSLFNLIEKTTDEVIEKFEEDTPSTSEYINTMLNHSGVQFKPENSAELTSKILSSVAEGRVRLSAVENQIEEVVQLLFRLCDKDSTLIEYQQQLINLLASNRVEDVVIVDTILKSCLRIFIGPDNIGTRTTAITWAGILSRRNNSLLIDLSGKAKFRDYGIEPVSLPDFLNERIQKAFLCVEGTVESVDDLTDAISEIKTRLNYYPHVTLILSSEQIEYLNHLATDTLTVHFVTDTSARGIALTTNTVSRFKSENVARKLILIDPSVDPMSVVNRIGIDPMTTKLITIPRMSRIQALSFNGVAPFNDSEVVEVFEEAFR